MTKSFIMVRPGKKSNTLQELAELATLPEFSGNESAVVRDAIHAKHSAEAKRILMVQHADGRVEVEPEVR